MNNCTTNLLPSHLECVRVITIMLSNIEQHLMQAWWLGACWTPVFKKEHNMAQEIKPDCFCVENELSDQVLDTKIPFSHGLTFFLCHISKVFIIYCNLLPDFFIIVWRHPIPFMSSSCPPYWLPGLLIIVSYLHYPASQYVSTASHKICLQY